jgi:hypothetical protein
VSEEREREGEREREREREREVYLYIGIHCCHSNIRYMIHYCNKGIERETGLSVTGSIIGPSLN